MLLSTGTAPAVTTMMMLGASSEAAQAVPVGCGVTTPCEGGVRRAGVGEEQAHVLACRPDDDDRGVNLVGA